MKGWGLFLIFVGVICAFLAIKMDTSVAIGLTGRVNNLGLMNLQTNLLIGAGIAFISGILLIGFSPKPEASSSEAIRICPYCAEQVKAQAVICRFCQKDLPVLNLDSADREESDVDLLRQQIITLRNNGLSYYLIAEDFNRKNVPIPKQNAKFKIWSPELVKHIFYGMGN